jgi:hypothetical protein
MAQPYLNLVGVVCWWFFRDFAKKKNLEIKFQELITPTHSKKHTAPAQGTASVYGMVYAQRMSHTFAR